MSQTPKVIFITGGSGFIGANLARACLDQGHQVHLILRPSYQPQNITQIKAQVKIHLNDLHEVNSLNEIFRRHNPDWVFHLAAHGAYSWQSNLDTIIKTNVFGTANLLRASIKSGVRVFINTGSSSEYGFKDHAPKENEIIQPNSYYAIAKSAATHFVSYETSLHPSIVATTFRLYSVYGPFEHPKRLIQSLLQGVLSSQLPPLARKEIARDFVFVGDITNAFLDFSKKYDPLVNPTAKTLTPSPIYNLGSGKQTTLAELVSLIRKLTPQPFTPKWNHYPSRSWDTSIWLANPTLAQKDFGWQASTSLLKGLQITFDWLQNQNPS